MVTYTIGGKDGQKISLRESKNKIVVRTKNARKLNEAVFSEAGKDILKKFDVEAEFPEADITVLQAKEDPTKAVLRDAARSVLNAEPEVRFAGRVLVENESNKPVLYTENFFIKFWDTVTADRCEEIKKENNLSIKQKLDFATNAYFAGAPENTGLEVFQIADFLLQLPEVELCHPELIRKKGL